MEGGQTDCSTSHPKIIRVAADDVHFPRCAALEGIYHLGEGGGDFPSYYKEAGGKCLGVTLQFDAVWTFKFGEETISVESTAENPSLIHPRALAKQGIISIRSSEKNTVTVSADLYVDPNFPADDTSIGLDEHGKKPDFIVGWKRPEEIHEGKIVLFGENGPHPDDLLQGQLGDCWLISAIRGVVQNSTNDIRKCFPEGEIRSDGSVLVVLFDPRQQKNVEYHLDTLLPLMKTKSEDCVKEAFARFPPASNQTIPIWGPLLEKACARLFGSYMKIEGGWSQVAYQILGFEEVGMMIDSRMLPKLPPNSWVMLTLNKDKQKEALAKDHAAFQSLAFYECSLDNQIPAKDLFSKLKTRLENGVVGAGTNPGTDHPGKDDKIGIVKGHAYNCRKFQTVTTADGYPFDLVCVANPWGEYGTKITGPTWHDEGSAWKKYPEIADQIHPDFKDDGSFWMNFSDTTHAFHNKEAPIKDCFLDYYRMIFIGGAEDDVGMKSASCLSGSRQKMCTLTDEEVAYMKKNFYESF